MKSMYIDFNNADNPTGEFREVVSPTIKHENMSTLTFEPRQVSRLTSKILCGQERLNSALSVVTIVINVAVIVVIACVEL